MTRYHNINGKLVAFTAEEETARDNEEAAAIAEKAATKYARERQSGTATTTGYITLEDQLDQLYHDMTDGKLGVAATTGSWYVGITSVKTAFPKPS